MNLKYNAFLYKSKSKGAGEIGQGIKSKGEIGQGIKS